MDAGVQTKYLGDNMRPPGSPISQMVASTASRESYGLNFYSHANAVLSLEFLQTYKISFDLTIIPLDFTPYAQEITWIRHIIDIFGNNVIWPTWAGYLVGWH